MAPSATAAPLELVLLVPGRRFPVSVDLAADATVGDLRAALAAAAGTDPALPLCHEGERLDDRTPVERTGLRAGSVVGVGTATAAALPVLTPLELAVTGGRHGGHRTDAPAGGVLLVGRDSSCSLSVPDAEVSREHLEVRIEDGGAVVRDTGSRNGTSRRGQQLDNPARLAVGDVVRVGETVLAVRRTATEPHPVERAAGGRLRVNRQPRLARPDPRHELVLPAAPEEPTARRFPVAAVLVPVALAGVMLAVWPGSMLYLVFLVLSPVMLVANAIGDRRSGRKDYLAKKAEHGLRITAVHQRVADLVDDEERSTRDTLPDPTAVVMIATTPTARLWERRCEDPDFLRLRLGLGDLPAGLHLRAERGADEPDQPVLRDVPVAVDLANDRVLGLAGPRDAALPLARAALAHAATLHAPRDLAVVLLTGRDRSADWEWASWLPHTVAPSGYPATRLVGTDALQVQARVDELRAVVVERHAARRSALAAAPAGRRWLVVVDGARTLRDINGFTELLQDGPAVGVHFLCLDDTEAALPSECGATAVTHGGGTRLVVRRGGPGGVEVIADVLADGLETAGAERLALALAPMELLGARDDGSDLPAAVRFVDLLHEAGGTGFVGDLTVEQVLAGWRRTARSTTALLGVGPDGPVTVDLRRDGPHALVAGTSGSGKSELLQTLIASLALSNRPDAMSFVLVDYKGGSAFKDAALLPHCAGLVTDLDEHLVARALASLTAELTRRERVLAAAGAKDIEELWTLEARDAGDAPTALPRLVIVVDEFASLVEEVPDFVKGVVGIGMRGRSLGVHVVLATQRPAGVVTGEIRANVNLRIALRVTSPGDSTDVVDTPEAAHISSRTPGRAFLRTGHGELTAFQAARVGWPVGDGNPTGGDQTRAVRRDVTGLGSTRARVAGEVTEDGRTDLTHLVRTVVAANEALGAQPVASPWLPPLPDTLVLTDVPAAPAGGAVVGLVDRPTRQAQEPFVLDLARTGSVLVAGTVRSGRSSALRTVAAALTTGQSPAELHLYALDCGNRALSVLAELPHCGAVVDGDDQPRVERLLAALDDEVARRQRLLGAGGYASVAEARAAGTELSQVVVLVDRLEAFLARYTEHDAGRPVDALERLLRQGPAVGVAFVLAADRTGVTPRLGSAVSARLVLRQADRDDVAVFGLSPRDVPADQPPGRGIWVSTGEEVQLALLDPDTSGAAQVDALRGLATDAVARWADVPGDRLPRRLDPLPETITLADLEQQRTVPAPAGGSVAVVAAGGDHLGPIDLDLAATGPCFVVSGTARSGRSTALTSLVHSVLARPDALPVLVVAPRPSPLRDLAGLPGVAAVLPGGPDLAVDLADVLAAHPGGLMLVVDDAELLTEGREGTVLEEVVRTARDTGTVVVAGATTEDLLLNRYRGWLATARRCRSGLLLGPVSPTDGEVFDLRLPRSGAASGPVGRALLVRHGGWAPVQVPRP